MLFFFQSYGNGTIYNEAGLCKRKPNSTVADVTTHTRISKRLYHQRRTIFYVGILYWAAFHDNDESQISTLMNRHVLRIFSEEC